MFDKRLDKNIALLKEFALRAERGEDIDSLEVFPDDELGNVSRQIVNLFSQLQQTKEALECEHYVVLQQEEEQVRIKKQLTQNINHELKTPVSSLQGYLETIINNPGLSEEKKNDFIQKSYAQVVRLSNLLNDISTLTRLDEAGSMIGKEDVCLNDVIEEVFAEARVSLEKRQMNTQITIPDHIQMKGNPQLLHSIFGNLMDNAIAYSSASLVSVRITQTDSHTLFVEFADNGVGVGEEHLARIFERFYRVDKGRSRKAGGTGLGLSIVKNAVQQHGGTITARLNEGGGLLFTFTLKTNTL